MLSFREFLTLLAGGGFLTGIGTLFMLRPRRANVWADSGAALSRAYGVQIDGLQRDIGRLDAEMQAMRTERAALLLELAAARDENGQLRKRMSCLEDELVALKRIK